MTVQKIVYEIQDPTQMRYGNSNRSFGDVGNTSGPDVDCNLSGLSTQELIDRMNNPRA